MINIFVKCEIPEEGLSIGDLLFLNEDGTFTYTYYGELSTYEVTFTVGYLEKYLSCGCLVPYYNDNTPDLV